MKLVESTAQACEVPMEGLDSFEKEPSYTTLLDGDDVPSSRRPMKSQEQGQEGQDAWLLVSGPGPGFETKPTGTLDLQGGFFDNHHVQRQGSYFSRSFLAFCIGSFVLHWVCIGILWTLSQDLQQQSDQANAQLGQVQQQNQDLQQQNQQLQQQCDQANAQLGPVQQQSQDLQQQSDQANAQLGQVQQQNQQLQRQNQDLQQQNQDLQQNHATNWHKVVASLTGAALSGFWLLRPPLTSVALQPAANWGLATLPPDPVGHLIMQFLSSEEARQSVYKWVIQGAYRAGLQKIVGLDPQQVQQRLAHIKAQLGPVQQQRDQANTQLGQVKKEKLDLQRERDQANTQLGQVKKEKLDLQQQRDQANTQLGQVKKEKLDLQRERDQANTQLGQVQQENQDLQRRKLDSQRQIVDLLAVEPGLAPAAPGLSDGGYG